MRSALCLSLLAVCATATVATAQKDRITWTDGTVTKDVLVSRFNLREVSFKSRGVEENRPTDQVAELSVDKVQDKYRRAFGAPVAEQVDTFLNLARDMKDDPFLAQFGYHEAAQILLDAGEYGDAFQILEELNKECPDSGFVPLLYQSKLDYYRALDRKGDFATVAKKYADQASTYGYPEGFVLEANYFVTLAKALNEEIDAAALRKEMQRIAAQASARYPVTAARAKLQIADALRIEGKSDDAKSEYEDIIEDKKTAGGVRAAAWLGLGHVLQGLGNPADKEPYHQALLAFLRVYLNDDAADSLRAEALFFASGAASKWGGEGSGRMAAVLRGRLKYQFPESPFASK